ncbi:MAG: response regulator [Elusimicrobia bacterium]|nr:response regulator [Elusimicrobiota bacterium]
MKRLLVVDDDPDIRRLVARQLKGQPYAVRAAADIGEARAALEAGPVDAVLLDVVLGAENGWELLRQIREGSSIPVLMMTGATVDEDTRIDARAMGALDVIAKPFDGDRLRRFLSDALGG